MDEHYQFLKRYYDLSHISIYRSITQNIHMHIISTVRNITLKTHEHMFSKNVVLILRYYSVISSIINKLQNSIIRYHLNFNLVVCKDA